MRVTIFTLSGQQGEMMRRDTVKMLKQLGIEGDVKLTSDEFEFACAGVLLTPAVSINGKLITNGWLPEEKAFIEAVASNSL